MRPTARLKSLRRDVTFEGRRITPGPPAEQHIRIHVPSKTQLYIDQTQRERDHYVQMHRTFQRDLFKLRLDVARGYVKALSSTGTVPVRLFEFSHL